MTLFADKDVSGLAAFDWGVIGSKSAREFELYLPNASTISAAFRFEDSFKFVLRPETSLTIYAFGLFGGE
jgi:hypothetical protein